MDSRISTSLPDVTSVSSAPRPTAAAPSVPFSDVLAGTVVSSAESAMTVLPGGPIMATAVRSAASHISTGGGGGAGVAGYGGVGAAISSVPAATGTTTGTTSGVGTTPEGTTSSGSSLGTAVLNAATGASTDPTTGIDSSLAQSQQQNLYYLQVQEQVNQQDRSFSTLSNVLKSEHDTMKTAIGNIH
jgi:hypothetical protein